MKRFVPITKLIGTFAFSFWALVINTTAPLVVLVAAELLLLAMCGSLSRNLKAVCTWPSSPSFSGWSSLVGGGSLESAYITGLRMMAMTVVFIILLTTTRLQDLTAALVKQVKIPYEYAFMFTAACALSPILSPKARPFRRLRPAAAYLRRATSSRR